jgi:FkbM family methyltransferase
VEPQSRLQGVIAANLGLNQCFNVRLSRAVLSGKTELAKLSLATEMNSGATSLFPGTKYSSETEAVQSFTLADFWDRCGLDKCDLMKVDIEGAEYDVFMGAEGVLRRGMIRTIALEFHPSILKQRGLSQDDLGRFILSCGYHYLGDSVYHWNE